MIKIKNGVLWYKPLNQIGNKIYPTKKKAREDFERDGLKCEGFIVLQEIRIDE